MSIEANDRDLNEIYGAVIALADAKKEITDADLLAIVEQRTVDVPDLICLEAWQVSSSHDGKASGTLSLIIEGQVCERPGAGNGPVDALYGAIDAALEETLGWRPILDSYEIKAVSGGEDAQGQVTVRVHRSNDQPTVGAAFVTTGHGLATDIIEASVGAYLAGAERLARQARGSAHA